MVYKDTDVVDAYSPTPPKSEPLNVIGKASWSRDAEECCNRCIANNRCKSWTRTPAGQCSLQASPRAAFAVLP